jgi:hypothetical protein
VTDEPGCLPEEIERGEDSATHLGKWGCFAVIAGVVTVIALIVWPAGLVAF